MSTEQRGITIVTYLANHITPIDVLSTTNFKLGNNVLKFLQNFPSRKIQYKDFIKTRFVTYNTWMIN